MFSNFHRELESEAQPGSVESRNWRSILKGLAGMRGAGTLVGTFLCLVAALITGALASGRTWGQDVPLMFSIVLLAVALLFGARAGVIGTLLSALIFAVHLFSPVGNYHVTSEVARTNLGWMLMIGIAFSFLFAPQKRTFRRH